jgi:hypothetical protein
MPEPIDFDQMARAAVTDPMGNVHLYVLWPLRLRARDRYRSRAG